MLNFEIKLGMEIVSVLKTEIEKRCNIPVKMQILLSAGGTPLSSEDRVCQFSAGTDTNPIFLYNKQLYHLPSNDPPKEMLRIDEGQDMPDMVSEYEQCLQLGPTINTVIVRTHLAQKFCEVGQEEQRICEQLVMEQHLMHQGYMCALANLDDLIPSAKANMDCFVQYFRDFLQTKDHYLQLAQSFEEISSTLASVPLLPILADVAFEDPMVRLSGNWEQFLSRKNSLSLLDWLHMRNSNDSIVRLTQMCLRGLLQHNEDIVNTEAVHLSKAITAAQDKSMRSIGGLTTRFSGLEALLRELQTCVREQYDLAQAFQQNSNRASNLGDASILPDLCASHKRQLVVIHKNHMKIRDIRRRMVSAKKELIKNIYIRLKWVHTVESEISSVSERTSMYVASLKALKFQLSILEQMHAIPQLYLTAVAEVVRRRTFSQAFLLWASDLACQLFAVHSEEVVRRQNFLSQFEGHMLENLFPGLRDMPPAFATQAPEPFDTKLPKLSLEDIELLREKVPDLALSISIPDLSAITQFFLSKSVTATLKPTKDNVASIEERLVEVVTAVGLDSNLDPTLLQPADSQSSAQSAGPSNTQPTSDRGFESETDTEEFEKHAGARCKPVKDHITTALTSLRQDLKVLCDSFLSDSEQIHSFLQQLSNLCARDITEKTEEIFRLQQQLSAQKAELVQERCRAAELGRQLKASMECECKERRRREELEAQRTIERNICEEERLRAVKEVTDQLNHDHRLELEAVRSRFRLMATATMERSPSECSLEKIERPLIDGEAAVDLAQLRAEMLLEKEKAVAEERQRWHQKLDHEIQQMKLRCDTEKQLWFNDAMRRVLIEKDRQVEALQLSKYSLETECQKHKDTINRLTGLGGSRGSDICLLERVEALETAKVRLKAELAEARAQLIQHATPTHQDMSTSISLIDTDSSGGSRDAATSPELGRRTQFKEKLTRSITSMIQHSEISVGSCNIGDTVLVVWDETYKSYTVLQDSTSLFFVHLDCLEIMDLQVPADGSPRRLYNLAVVTEKEYCHARKPGNRYRVPKGTKFYRIKVKPLQPVLQRSQSTSTST